MQLQMHVCVSKCWFYRILIFFYSSLNFCLHTFTLRNTFLFEVAPPITLYVSSVPKTHQQIDFFYSCSHPTFWCFICSHLLHFCSYSTAILQMPDPLLLLPKFNEWDYSGVVHISLLDTVKNNTYWKRKD